MTQKRVLVAGGTVKSTYVAAAYSLLMAASGQIIPGQVPTKSGRHECNLPPANTLLKVLKSFGDQKN